MFLILPRVSWSDKRSNDWVPTDYPVLQKTETKTDPHLLQSIKKRKLYFYGHVLRKEESVWRRKLYKVLHQVKDAEEDQRPVVMTTSWSERTLSAEACQGHCLLSLAGLSRQWR